MTDLFDGPSIPGLRMQTEFVTRAEEKQLIAFIEASALQPFRFHQWTGNRLSKSFGWEYDPSHAAIKPAN